LAAFGVSATLLVALASTASATTPTDSTTPADGSAAPADTAGGDAAAVDLEALQAAAEEEGQVNLIALPPTWANYAGVIASFNEKYPAIETPVQLPDAASADELVAVDTQRGSDTMPDVLDISPAISIQAVDEGYFGTYMPSLWDEIPDSLKDPDGHWVASYYGVLQLGVNNTIVPDFQPTSFADLRNAPAGTVSINDDPRIAGAAFAAVMAASLANGGSFDDIMPGIQYFADLAEAGIFNPTNVTEATILSGETPIVIDWSYNFPGLIPKVEDAGFEFFTAFPTDAVYASYYCQGVVADSPNPNAAKLWVEHLVSDEAALEFLEGGAIPARFPTLVENGTITEEMQANLPPAELIADVSFMTPEQTDAANAALVENWGPMVLGE
jgi:putative spermidine/putrescine transport system substrate-binding protein